MQQIPLPQVKAVGQALQDPVHDEHARKPGIHQGKGKSKIYGKGKDKMDVPRLRYNPLCSQEILLKLRRKLRTRELKMLLKRQFI